MSFFACLLSVSWSGLLLEFLFMAFACLSLAYVSMATSFGPWIAPLLIIFGHFILKFWPVGSAQDKSTQLYRLQISGSLAALVATAVGFTLPTLYFLDIGLWQGLMQHPVQLCVQLGGIVLVAGVLGSYIASWCVSTVLYRPEFKHPVSRLIADAASEAEEPHGWSLPGGIGVSGVLLALRDGVAGLPSLLSAKSFNLLGMFSGAIRLTLPLGLFPTMWAVGFMAGRELITSLVVGFLARDFVLYPLNHHSQLFNFNFFTPQPDTSFAFAFCTGIILFDLGFYLLRSVYKKMHGSGHYSLEGVSFLLNKNVQLSAFIMTLLAMYYKFSLLAAVLMTAGAMLVAYELVKFVARAGIAPFGRFATLAMLPLLLLANAGSNQVVWACVFVTVCGAAAVNFAIQHKAAESFNVPEGDVWTRHIFGIFFTAFIIGIIFYWLFTTFKLGSAELFAQRGQARALLIQAPSLERLPILLGLAFAVLLKYFKVSGTMVFGGIIMPKEMIVALVSGGVLSATPLGRQKNVTHFFTGLFAGESLFLVMSLLAKMLI